MKLTKRDVTAYKRARENLGKWENKIESRTDEVLSLIHTAFGAKLGNWWFPNAEEGERGTVDPHDLTEDGWIDVEFWENRNLHTENVDFCYGFPTAYLYMEDYEIVGELEEMIEETKKKEVERKAAAKKRMIDKGKARKKVLKKLTPEEQKLLGVK